MAKIATSLTLPLEQFDAITKKAHKEHTSKAKLFSIGVDLLCSIPEEVYREIKGAAALLSTDVNTIILNMITARVAELKIARKNGTDTVKAVPEITSRRLSLQEVMALIE